ncbi:hypothetical protein [Novosphingobium humi]|uniref:Flap endonuclease-1-like 5' DNA nuclease n=1 Tax=Novosphingobium humi TaxID=2282397 RepID=A0ABY7TUF2_9SPHN|nr:hypothetical protein [Novosphingobium humi]WCT76861.1 hypothetical protein PQ457_13140 [Novosphingobium humi]WJS99621.1 hypothetical protein NYQ05_05600 [Novosphingobium humi]
MVELFQSYPLAIVGALVLLALLAGLLLRRGKATRERHRAPDAMDEGVGPAQRNSALINAPSAASKVSLRPVEPVADVAVKVEAEVEPDAFGELAEAVAAQEAATQTDDLTRIKGLGPKLKARLAELGVVSFAQIAGWSEADIAAIDAQLGTFAGRATRDQWVAQAQFLASGDIAGYEAKFGKL